MSIFPLAMLDGLCAIMGSGSRWIKLYPREFHHDTAKPRRRPRVDFAYEERRRKLNECYESCA